MWLTGARFGVQSASGSSILIVRVLRVGCKATVIIVISYLDISNIEAQVCGVWASPDYLGFLYWSGL